MRPSWAEFRPAEAYLARWDRAQPQGKGQDGRQCYDTPRRTRCPWRIGAFLDTCCAGRRSRQRPEISPDRRQRRAAARAYRRSDCGLDGAGACASFAAGSGAVSGAWRQERPCPRSPDRLDLSRPEPRRAGAERLGAGYNHRKLRCSRTAGRDRVANPFASDRVLLSERRGPGARRASVSWAHYSSRAGLRRLGAKGAWALRGASFEPSETGSTGEFRSAS